MRSRRWRHWGEGNGEGCPLPRWLGSLGERRNRFWCILTLKEPIWRQDIWYLVTLQAQRPEVKTQRFRVKPGGLATLIVILLVKLILNVMLFFMCVMFSAFLKFVPMFEVEDWRWRFDKDRGSSVVVSFISGGRSMHIQTSRVQPNYNPFNTGDRAFSVAASWAGNRLPASVRTATSFNGPWPHFGSNWRPSSIDTVSVKLNDCRTSPFYFNFIDFCKVPL